MELVERPRAGSDCDGSLPMPAPAAAASSDGNSGDDAWAARGHAVRGEGVGDAGGGGDVDVPVATVVHSNGGDTPCSDADGTPAAAATAAALPPVAGGWRRHPALPSSVYAVLALAVGVQVAVFGPALLRLSAQVGASLGDTAYASAARTIASLVASAAGPVFDVVAGGAGGRQVTCCRRTRRVPAAINAHTLMGGAAIVGGLGSALIPLARSLGALYVGLALQGAASGLLDTGSNLLIMWLWHERRAGGPWMQTLHFGFAAGATLAPLLLRAAEAAGEGGSYAGGGTSPGARDNNTTPAGTGANDGGAGTYAYAFLALAALYVVCGTTLAFVPAPASPWLAATHKVTAPSDGATASPPPAPPSHAVGATRRIWVVMSLVASIFMLYVGSEHSYGTFLTPYAIFVMGRSEAFGQYATAVYWAAMTAGRFGSICASMLLAPATLLTLAMTSCAAAAVALAAVPVHSEASLLVLSAVFGVAMAPQYPSTLALAATFAPLRAAYTTLFSLCNSGGAWLLPFIVASFLKGVPAAAPQGGSPPDPDSDARAMMVVVAVACAANLCVFLAAWRAGTRLRVALRAASA